MQGGSPKRKDDYRLIRQDGVSLWVPKDMAFHAGEVRFKRGNLRQSEMLFVSTAVIP